jgi:hypothetical protein
MRAPGGEQARSRYLAAARAEAATIGRRYL